jgi:hypothetical protein
LIEHTLSGAISSRSVCWFFVLIRRAVGSTLDPEAIQAQVIAYLKTFAAPAEEDQRDRIAADLAEVEKEVEGYADAIGLGGDLPLLVAKLKAATAQVESLRATLAVIRRRHRWDELDPEDLADALKLSREVSPDLTADWKVLRALGVQITVDPTLKEAVIQGNLDQVVAAKLGYAQSPIPVGGQWISL